MTYRLQPLDGQNHAMEGLEDEAAQATFLTLVPDAEPPPPLPNVLAPWREPLAATERELTDWIDSREVGRASKTRLHDALARLLVWAVGVYDPERSPLSRFVRGVFFDRVWPEYIRQVPISLRERELADERHRDAALASDEARAHYLEHWRERVQSLARPGSRFAVTGMAPEDVAGELVLRLHEALGSGDVDAAARAGKQATFLFLAEAKDKLRKRAALYVVEAPLSVVAPLPPTPLELMLRVEHEAELGHLPIALAHARLTRRQRQYLTALRAEAAWSAGGTISQQAVAERLGVHRAQVSRVLQRIADRLREQGLHELLEVDPPSADGRKRLW